MAGGSVESEMRGAGGGESACVNLAMKSFFANLVMAFWRKAAGVKLLSFLQLNIKMQ